eukprot:176623-Prymnesium_polylepis.5
MTALTTTLVSCASAESPCTDRNGNRERRRAAAVALSHAALALASRAACPGGGATSAAGVCAMIPAARPGACPSLPRTIQSESRCADLRYL